MQQEIEQPKARAIKRRAATLEDLGAPTVFDRNTLRYVPPEPQPKAPSSINSRWKAPKLKPILFGGGRTNKFGQWDWNRGEDAAILDLVKKRVNFKRVPQLTSLRSAQAYMAKKGMDPDKFYFEYQDLDDNVETPDDLLIYYKDKDTNQPKQLFSAKGLELKDYGPREIELEQIERNYYDGLPTRDSRKGMSFSKVKKIQRGGDGRLSVFQRGMNRLREQVDDFFIINCQPVKEGTSRPSALYPLSRENRLNGVKSGELAAFRRGSTFVWDDYKYTIKFEDLGKLVNGMMRVFKATFLIPISIKALGTQNNDFGIGYIPNVVPTLIEHFPIKKLPNIDMWNSIEFTITNPIGENEKLMIKQMTDILQELFAAQLPAWKTQTAYYNLINRAAMYVLDALLDAESLIFHNFVFASMPLILKYITNAQSPSYKLYPKNMEVPAELHDGIMNFDLIPQTIYIRVPKQVAPFITITDDKEREDFITPEYEKVRTKYQPMLDKFDEEAKLFKQGLETQRQKYLTEFKTAHPKKTLTLLQQLEQQGLIKPNEGKGEEEVEK
jgi:hypothetical protein